MKKGEEKEEERKCLQDFLLLSLGVSDNEIKYKALITSLSSLPVSRSSLKLWVG